MFDHCLQTRVNNGTQPPDDSVTHKQKIWDKIVVDVEYSHLLSRYSKPYHRARLLAVAAPHSGDWLHTLPISACRLHLDDNAICVAVGLRLGCAICEAHCCTCGVMVDHFGQHALFCKKQLVRQSSASCLAERLDSRRPDPDRNTSSQGAQGLSRDERKRPDGLTLVPWQLGRNVTVAHTHGNILRGM